MRSYFITILLFILSFQLFAQDLTMQDIWMSREYLGISAEHIDFLNTNSNYTILVQDEEGNQAIESHDIASEKKTKDLFKASNYNNLPFISSYTFSKDDNMILLKTEVEQIYRRSTKANFYTYNIAKKKLSEVSADGKQMYPNFSPDNEKVAFIRENNLFYKELKSGKEVQITDDGLFNHIINGYSDWVYEEEFYLKRAYEWSADGSKILFIQFDESEVREYSLLKYKDDNYPEVYTYKFPKTGEDNSKVKLKIYDLKSKELSTLDIPYEFEYIPRIYATDTDFAFLLLNRHQNHMKLIKYNLASKEYTSIYEEKDERYIDLPIVLDYLAGNNWIISSEKDGWNHLYTIINGTESAVTSGQFEITKFYGIDQEGWVYYQSTEESDVQRHTYKINLNSGEKVKLTSQEGNNSANFSGDNQYFINKYHADGVPTQVNLYDNSGKLVRAIEDNKGLKKKLDKFWIYKDFFEIPFDGFALNAWMIKPRDFNPTKRYPVLMYLYGGPGDQNVGNEWGGYNDLWFQMLAQQGYIIVSVDNRGTGVKGAEFKKMTYQQLGKYELEDQVNCAKYLGQLPYVDADNIGIFGWSYGGFMSALCLFKGKGAFKAALSVAPITHWKFYDTIYTERYMRSPQENKRGYDNYSPLESVHDWESGDLFLAHGTADDNVHFQNSIALVEKMNQARKQYDFYAYPDRAHGIGGLSNRFHLFQKMTEFLDEKLKVSK